MRKLLLSLILFKMLLMSQQASATTYIRQLWDAKVFEADFVGVVECVTAGHEISEHQVLEVWKGSPEKKIIRLDFSSVNCGVRFLICAQSSHDLPLANFKTKAIPCDYSLNAQFSLIPSMKEGSVEYNLSEAFMIPSNPSLESLKARTKRFLTLTPEAQEREIILSAIDRKLSYYAGARLDKKENEEFELISAISNKVKASKSLSGAIKALSSFRRDLVRKDLDGFIGQMLGDTGRNTLAILTSRTSQRLMGRVEKEEVVIYLRARMGRFEPEVKVEKPVTPTAEKLAFAEWRWSTNKTFSQSIMALSDLDILIEHSPAYVTERLLIWESIAEEKQDLRDLASYFIISRFGNLCPTNRAKFLTELSKAKDQIVRVGAAIYLSMENATAGESALKEISKSPNDAGLLASFELARRGDKSMMPRALELLSHRVDFYPAEWHFKHTKKEQLLALLSNSAKASGVPQPALPYDEWWKKYGDKVALHDPWLAEMDQLKID